VIVVARSILSDMICSLTLPLTPLPTASNLTPHYLLLSVNCSHGYHYSAVVAREIFEPCSYSHEVRALATPTSSPLLQNSSSSCSFNAINETHESHYKLPAAFANGSCNSIDRSYEYRALWGVGVGGWPRGVYLSHRGSYGAATLTFFMSWRPIDGVR